MVSKTGRRVFLLAAWSTLLIGCGAPRIPNAVTDREYEVYAAWIKHRFEKKPPKALFLYSRTTVFDPLEPYGCGNILHQLDAVPWDMIQRFHDLGTAEYRLIFDFDLTHSRIGLAHTVIDSPPTNAKFGYDALTFSRVAFNRAGDKALFEIGDLCGFDCGGGGAVIAHKVSGAWQFQSAHCRWIF